MPPITLGVMTLLVSPKQQFEDQIFFRKLSLAGKKIGVEVIVFTPQDVDESRQQIYAYRYAGTRWVREWTPYPDLFLDRSRYHSPKKYQAAREFRKRNPQLKFISSPLAGKWHIHQQLSKQPSVSKHLPATVMYRTFDDLLRELAARGTVYLKPINGTGGRGILRIEQLPGRRYLVSGRLPNRKIMPERKVNVRQLRTIVQSRKPQGRYIIQQSINLRLRNGSVHDYRLLIQKNGSGKWEVTGCAGRVGPSGSVTSNLHGGGKAVPMRRLLKLWFASENKARRAEEEMYALAHRIAEALESLYGPLCELALDIAVDRSGHLWLLEVNTKPAREVFNRIRDNETYLKAIRRPLEYARWLHRNKETA